MFANDGTLGGGQIQYLGTLSPVATSCCASIDQLIERLVTYLPISGEASTFERICVAPAAQARFTLPPLDCLKKIGSHMPLSPLTYRPCRIGAWQREIGARVHGQATHGWAKDSQNPECARPTGRNLQVKRRSCHYPT